MVLGNVEVGYLGIDFAQQYDAMSWLFKRSGKELHLFEGSWLNALGHRAGTGPLKSLYYKNFGVRNGEYRRRLEEYFRRSRVNCILAYWGTNPIADAISIKKFHPETKIILNVLCHPIGLTPVKIFLQNMMMKRSLKYFDGVIYPGQVMKEYFRRHVSRGASVPELLLPPLLHCLEGSDRMQPAPCGNIPNVLFLGRMDCQGDSQATDNVAGQLDGLMQAGIHVYHSDKTGKVPRHAFRHTFHPMQLSGLAAFSRRFDASVILYNLEACERDDRFRNTIPDRLVASVSFGLPVAIPAKGYDACREFLKDYGAIIPFETVKELKEQLADRDNVRRLKELAQVNRKKYYLENYAGEIFGFIDKVCERRT